jgi:hypothetical protein
VAFAGARVSLSQNVSPAKPPAGSLAERLLYPSVEVHMLRYTCTFLFSIIASVGVAPAQDLPGMAAGVVQQSELARQAVARQDSAAALDHIRQATALADEIFKVAPPQPQPVLVRIYKEIDTTSTYSPVKGRSRDDLTPDRLKKDTSVRDVEANITTERLDVNSAAARLQAAQTALEHQDWVTASSELDAIPAGLIRTNVEGNMPLLGAQQNLRLARMRVLEQKFKDARAPLRAAAQDLADYEKLSPGPRAQDAEYLRGQIEAYSRTIAHDHAAAANQIDAWLAPIEKWNGETVD